MFFLSLRRLSALNVCPASALKLPAPPFRLRRDEPP
jgi:hypothetical protein